MKHLPSPISYREDINGLRAWAVIAVLLFHFKLPGVSAGFIGVDVFFVISGFLMTAIIVKGLEGQNFSIWQFYMARIRRIAPALMVLVAVLLVLGWFWLPTPDYQSLGTQSAYSLAFLSNIHYWQSSGYFDAAAQEKWLLHTWSLGIEAQFYVLFPIYLMILWKIKPHIKTLFWGLSFAFAASLAVSIGVSHLKPSAAFYLLPTRGWELAAGGLAFLIGREVLALQRFAKPMFWLGIGLWLSAVFLLDSSYAWPSGWGLLPVLGAVFIILANQSQAKLMVNPIAQWVGQRSYSLYLWHWPLVVALYFAGLQNDWLWVSGAIVLSLVLAHLSYHLVEVPTRSYLSASSLRKEIFAIALAGLVIGLAAVSVKMLDFGFRAINQSDKGQYLNYYSRDNFVPLIRKDYLEKCNFFDGKSYTAKKTAIDSSCTKENGNQGIFIWGDSHAQALSYGLRKWADTKHPPLAFYQVASSGCRAHLTADTQTTGEFKLACDRSNNYAIDSIERLKPTVVIIAQRDRHDKNDFDAIAKKLKSIGVSYILIVGPVPQWEPSLPQAIARRHWNGNPRVDDPSFIIELAEMDQKLQEKYENSTLIKYLSIQNHLCDGSNCLAKLDLEKTPLVFDYGHLTLEGSEYVVKNVIAPELDKIFK